MNASKKRYDNKHKLTRILLADYLLLKKLATSAGVSMAEALHKLIVKQAEPEPEPIAKSVTQPVFRVKSPVVFQVSPNPIIVANGHKAGVFVIKPKGGVIND